MERCAVRRKLDAPSPYLFVPSGIRLLRSDILCDIDFARFSFVHPFSLYS